VVRVERERRSTPGGRLRGLAAAPHNTASHSLSRVGHLRMWHSGQLFGSNTCHFFVVRGWKPGCGGKIESRGRLRAHDLREAPGLG
jgi:hypothetical protein